MLFCYLKFIYLHTYKIDYKNINYINTMHGLYLYIFFRTHHLYLFIRSFRFILIANNDNIRYHHHQHHHRIFGANIGTNVFRKDFKIN